MHESFGFDRESLILLLVLLFIFFGFMLTNGFYTIPNWDYFKYNYILENVFRDILNPSLEHKGKTIPLAYYYAIFLPAAWFGKFYSLFTAVEIAQLQIFFNLWFLI